MKNKQLKIGVLKASEHQKRNLDIITGNYNATASTDTNIWFNSIRSIAEILHLDNLKLLHLIEQEKPESINELAQLSGRKNSNLSRTLKTLARHGIIELKRANGRVLPIVKGTEFIIHYSL